MDKTCHPHHPGGDAAPQTATPGGLRAGPAATHVFTPERIAAAVKFHLLDEEIVAGVCPRSIERVVRRMARAALSLEIPAARWRGMDNRQRLEWLLVSSCTDYRAGGRDGMAVLV